MTAFASGQPIKKFQCQVFNACRLGQVGLIALCHSVDCRRADIVMLCPAQQIIKYPVTQGRIGHIHVL
jgi:hypothetical protein